MSDDKEEVHIRLVKEIRSNTPAFVFESDKGQDKGLRIVCVGIVNNKADMKEGRGRSSNTDTKNYRVPRDGLGVTTRGHTNGIREHALKDKEDVNKALRYVLTFYAKDPRQAPDGCKGLLKDTKEGVFKDAERLTDTRLELLGLKDIKEVPLL